MDNKSPPRGNPHGGDFSLKQYLAHEKIRMSLRASAHTGVAIRIPLHTLMTKLPKRRTDCHTSDIGHWFAMTTFVVVRCNLPNSNLQE